MKIQLKRSNVLQSGSAKVPTASQLEYGELAINYNTDDPAIFIKDSNNNIIRVAGVGNIADDGQVELPSSTTPPSNPVAGNLWYNSDDGRLYIYYVDSNSSQWVDASPDSWDNSVIPDTSNSAEQSGTLDDRYLLQSGDDVTGQFTVSGGNFGVGTTSPSQMVDVNQPTTGSFATFRVQNADGVQLDISARPGSDASIVSTIAGDDLFFGTENTERLRIQADGKVGIGTASPTQQLDLEGSAGARIAFTDTGTRRYSIGNAGTGSSSLTVRDESGSADRIVITNGGDIGIATSTPLEKLHVNAGNSGVTSTIGGVDGAVISTGAGRTGGLIFFTPNDRSAGIFFGDPEDSNIASYKYDHASNATIIGSNNAERLRIDSSGRILVATSSTRAYPNGQGQSQNNPLQIESNGDISGLSISSFRSNNTGPANLILNKANGSQTTPTSITSSSILGQVTFNGYDGSNFIRGAKIEAAVNGTPGTNDMPTRLSFFTSAESSATPTERMRIASDGHVGIGTTDPATDFVVSNNGAHGFEILPQLSGDTTVTSFNRSTSAYNPLRVRASVFKISPDGNEKVRITSDGKVGIGITAPTELLEIQDPTAARAAFTHTGSRRYSVGTKDNSATFTIRDETGSADRFTLRSTGNIGIGTGDPAGLFHIQRSDDNFIRLSTGTTAADTEQGLLHYGRYINGTTPAHPGQLTSFIKEVRNGSSTQFSLLFGTTDSGSNDATEKMRIAADGKVGIGTTAPVQELEVSSGSVPTLRLSDTDTALSDDEDSSAIEFYQSDSSGAGVNASIHARGDGSIGRLALQFNAGDNTEKMRITSNGHVGIGTPDPDSPLEIKTTTASDLPLIRVNTFRPAIRFVDASTSAADGEIVQDSGDMRFRISEESGVATALTERMRLTSTGRLGIGSTNPGRTISIYNNDPGIRITDSDSSGNHFDVRCVTGDGLLQVTGAKALKVLTNQIERMRVTGDGHVLIGQNTTSTPGFGGNTTTGAAFEKGSTHCSLFLSRQDNASLFINSNQNTAVTRFSRSGTQVGAINVTTTSTSYATSSDYRLKENVVELGGAIDRVNQLQPKRFNFIAEPGTTVDGFLAHEAQTVVPEAVTGTHNEVDDEGNPVMQGIDHSKLVPLLTAALQEALGKIDNLEQRLSDAGL